MEIEWKWVYWRRKTKRCFGIQCDVQYVCDDFIAIFSQLEKAEKKIEREFRYCNESEQQL